MKKDEYLAQLVNELKKNAVADADDIANEYEQHFAFKMADGFSEDEIAAKLGTPAALAAQFESNKNMEKSGGRKITTIIGLVFADIFIGGFFALLFTWEAIMAAFSLTCSSCRSLMTPQRSVVSGESIFIWNSVDHLAV